MTDQLQHSDAQAPRSTDASQLKSYLALSRWRLEDQDDRTSLWLPPLDAAGADVQVVVPEQPGLVDHDDRVLQALRAVAWVEQRRVDDVTRDVSTGGADSLSVRLSPPGPSGEAPLDTAYTALASLRDLVIGAAVGVDAEADALVLPSRRPARAEAYVSQTRVTTRPGSFIIDVSFPLTEDGEAPSSQVVAADGGTPFGRRITTRLAAVAVAATALANRVGEGEVDLAQFAEDGAAAGNATELDALAHLGQTREGRSRYQLRFTQTPLLLPSAFDQPAVLTVTPSQQAVLLDAARYLRERRSRAGVTVEGLVVRLSRGGAVGAGDVVVEGVDDDTGIPRRYAVNLSEDDYADALRAHSEGYRVVVAGDLDVRGTRRSLRNVASFDVIARPGEE